MIIDFERAVHEEFCFRRDVDILREIKKCMLRFRQRRLNEATLTVYWHGGLVWCIEATLLDLVQSEIKQFFVSKTTLKYHAHKKMRLRNN